MLKSCPLASSLYHSKPHEAANRHMFSRHRIPATLNAHFFLTKRRKLLLSILQREGGILLYFTSQINKKRDFYKVLRAVAGGLACSKCFRGVAFFNLRHFFYAPPPAIAPR